MSTLVTGSLSALVGSIGALGDLAGAAVVVVPSAAAFTGASAAALEVALALEPTGASVEALMVLERSSVNESAIVARVARADVVVLTDGSALHARAVWRDSAVGEAIGASRLVAIGAVATVLGSVMIDPRGGAPTVGLGYRDGAVLTVPSTPDQLTRTRALLSGEAPLVVVGARGVVGESGGEWYTVVAEDVEVTRGPDAVTLGTRTR